MANSDYIAGLRHKMFNAVLSASRASSEDLHRKHVAEAEALREKLAAAEKGQTGEAGTEKSPPPNEG